MQRAAMIKQSPPVVFAASGSRQAQPQPRSILKKSSSAPTSPSRTTPSSPLASPPLMPSTPDPFAFSGYRPSQWSAVSIARTQQRRPSASAHSKNAETANTSLTVTLLYMPTETLYAWPFNLSSPDAKGVCYETCSHGEDGATRHPPEGTMSTSLRVLADVIRYWMRIRRERSALAQHRGSTGSTSPGPDSPGTQLDKVLDDDEVINEIIDALRLYRLTPFERSIYLMRQKLPEPSSPKPTELEQQSSASASGSSSHRSRPQSSSSVSSSEAGSESDRDSRHRSDSSASSQASTVESSPERSFKAKPSASPKLPKINTSVAPAEPEDTKTAVPQIRLLEATPQESSYEERDRVLERSVASTPRNGSFGGRSMDTVHEDASEDVETDDAAASSGDGEIRLIQIQPSHPSKEDEEASSPKTAPLSISSSAPQDNNSGRSSNVKPSSSSPTRVTFRDPFKGIQRSSSKPDIRVETIEYGSPDSLLMSSKIKSSKRRSLDGLRSIFGGRGKSQ